MASAKRQDRVQDAVDATKRFQDASERRYKYRKSVSGFINDYFMDPYYKEVEDEAKRDMKDKARIAELTSGTQGLMEAIESRLKKKEPKKMRSGGYVRKADGCAKKGKTRGKYV